MSAARKLVESEPRLPMQPLVRVGESEAECWEWLGKKSKVTGYGCKTFAGKTMLAHRWVWLMLFGPIPDDLVINHKCSNRICVNPHHLEVTDQAGNCRHGKGTKLTEDQVREIRAANLGSRVGGCLKLAKKLNVTVSTIKDVASFRSWKDIK